MEVQGQPKLRDYQQADVTFILDEKHVGLFNEMRTGKTATALNAAEQVAGQILILCPACLIPVWEREIKLWCVKRTKYLLYSYETIRGNKHALEYLRTTNFSMIILDEAHKIKNRKSKTGKAVLKLHAPYQIAITGTPSTNAPWDVWMILHWLRPYEYRSYWDFIGMYFECTSNYFCSRIPVGYKPGAEQLLSEKLSEFCTNRKLAEVVGWETDMDCTDIVLQPTKSQLKAINTLMDTFEVQGLLTKTVLDKLTRIRQLCLEPDMILAKHVPSEKTRWLKKFLKTYEDSSIVILTTSAQYIDTVLKDLVDRTITGETPKKQRRKDVDDFQNGKIRTLAMNTAIGKEGWTLDMADYLIFMDCYPPASDYIQASKRIVPTNADMVKPKQIIRVRLAETYDNELYDLVDNNCNLTDVINNFKNYRR